MKKAIFVIIFGLLLSGNAYAVVTKEDIGTSAKKVCGKLYFCYANTISSIYFAKYKNIT